MNKLDAARTNAARAAADMASAAKDITRTEHPGWLPIGLPFWTGTKLPSLAVNEATQLLSKIIERENTAGQFHLDDPDLRRAAEKLVDAVTRLDSAEKEITALAPATKESVNRSHIYGLSMNSIYDTTLSPIKVSGADTKLAKELDGALKQLEEYRVLLKGLFDEECIHRYGAGNNSQYKAARDKFEAGLVDLRSRTEFSPEAREAMWQAGVKDLGVGAWLAVRAFERTTFNLPIFDHPQGSLAGVERVFKAVDIFIDIAKTALHKEGAKTADQNTVHPWM